MSLPRSIAFFCLMALVAGGCGKPAPTASKKDAPPPRKKTDTPEPPPQTPGKTPEEPKDETPKQPESPAETQPPQQDPPKEPAKDPSNEGPDPQAAQNAPKKSDTPDPPGMVRLSPVYDIWHDPKNKRIAMLGYVCLRMGQLEMLVTLKGTKEHEAVVAVDTKAFIVHATLLRMGAEAKHPVKFRPKYTPASGTEIDVHFEWTGPDGKKHLVRAQEWVRQIRTQREMEHAFVFGGSGFYRDEADGREHYLAEEGDFICVSNFPTAMMDLPVESSQSADGLMFEAFTERLPPTKTPVMVYLTPKLKPQGDAPAKKAEKAAGD